MKFIVIKNIHVTNANAVAGLTWGFPSVTAFLGFINNLNLKLDPKKLNENAVIKHNFSDIMLNGCAIVSHQHHVHTYRPYTDDKKQYEDDIHFAQKRGSRYMLFQKDKPRQNPPSVIEEAKMNMTVSLVIPYSGRLASFEEEGFKSWLLKACYNQSLAGGSIQNVEKIMFFNITDKKMLLALKRELMPGFVLLDRTEYLKKHYDNLLSANKDAELFDAWLDFSVLKQKARPKANDIRKYFSDKKIQEVYPDVYRDWLKRLASPYQKEHIPDAVYEHFLNADNIPEKLKQQWNEYCQPNEETEVDWEYQPKPFKGYLVPIMCGYRGLSEVHNNADIQDTRDNITPVCFVESVHSIGEWQSVLKIDNMFDTCWKYQAECEEGWYLCTQSNLSQSSVDGSKADELIEINPEDDFE